MNLLPDGRSADFIVAGTWSQKAVAEARRFGNAHVAATSEASNFDHVPTEASWSESPAYIHITSNETIHGVQWHDRIALPAGVPVIVDASSDIFSGPIDVRRYGLIYAGAQKNLGPAGVTVALARKALVDKPVRDLPTMLRYNTHVKEHSLHNTPSTFAIYVVSEVLQWIKAQGGLAAMAELNAAKAGLLYDYLDASQLFHGHARTDSRSTMNITFRSGRPDLDAAFIAGAESRNLAGMGGHRSVGGMRASLYNAFPIEGVRALVQYMDEFERAQR
jgi:phosphoserine aminotransferase